MRVSLLTQIAPEKKLLERLKPAAIDAISAFIAVSFIQRTAFKHIFHVVKGILDRGRDDQEPGTLLNYLRNCHP